jgi:deltex-like protein
LVSILYYTAPESAKEGAQIQTRESLQKLVTANPSQTEHCIDCNNSLQEEGVICRLPNCQHEFHIDCLLKKLDRYPDHCPACDAATGFLPGCLLSIEPECKPPTLIIDSRSGYENIEHGHAQQQCTTTECYVTLNQPLGGDRDRFNQPKLSFSYACGSTFDVSLSNHSGEQSVVEAWHKMFDSTDFLQRFQLRVKQHSNKCSSCRRACRKSREKVAVGTMPCGMMRIEDAKKLQCSGYEEGSFLIIYRIEGGIQKCYHPKPGRHFDPTYREAYLPKNYEGYSLLKRLKFAFSRGMIFQVGKSISTGLENQIVWSSIPHRTSLGRSTFGYPDTDYFIDANKELDDLGVPSANDL